jgi:hypothetical protein
MQQLTMKFPTVKIPTATKDTTAAKTRDIIVHISLDAFTTLGSQFSSTVIAHTKY